MAKVFLALLLVAALGLVVPATSAKVDDVKSAWQTFIGQGLTSCDTPCPSTDVNVTATAATADADVYLLCQKINVYLDCAGKDTACNSLDKQTLEAQCSKVDLVKAAWDAFNAQDLTSCDTPCPSTDVATAAGAAAADADLYPLCQKIKDYSVCANKETGCTLLDTQTLDDECSTVITTTTKTTTTTTTTTTSTKTTTTVGPFVSLKSKWSTFKTGQDIATNCDTTCPSTDVEDALTKDLDTFCHAIVPYYVCATGNCTLGDTQQLDEINNQCKTGGDDDDGCSILQVSTLALMLSLLLSII